MREVSRLPRNTFEEDESLRLKFGKKEILKSAHYIGRYKWRMLLALLLSALSSVIALTGPLIMKQAVDVNIPAGDVKGLSGFPSCWPAPLPSAPCSTWCGAR